MTYIGRLAPSPTGYLHLGHAATFLAAGDRAQAARGRLLLRIDDLDPQRSRAPFIEAAREDLRWLGLRWDEEHRQSERTGLYRAAMERLLNLGLAYPCTCSRRDLQGVTQAPHEDAEDEPMYIGRCRPRGAPETNAGPSGNELQAGRNYRLRTPDGEALHFADGLAGPQCYMAGVDFSDFVVWRRDGLPSYQLACVVDDAAMKITEVVRGRDLLKSTARQILLQRALGLQTPAYVHTELLRDGSGQRLAKRHDALSLRALRANGVTSAEIRTRVEAAMHHSRTRGIPCTHDPSL